MAARWLDAAQAACTRPIQNAVGRAGSGGAIHLRQGNAMDNGTPTQLSALRGLLTSRLQELQAELRAAELARDDVETSTEVSDRKDDASRSMVASISDAEAGRHRVEMAEIEHALQRLDAGSYGNCIDCDEPIPLARLRVLPAALRCASCQGRVEQRAA
jgi:RNA polymerase-binding transcription factor DksA